MLSLFNYLKSIVFYNESNKFLDLKFIKIQSSNTEDNLNPIVIVPGLFSSKNSFIELGTKLSDLTKRIVFIPDIRCHGDTAHTPEFTYQLMVNDLVEFLKKQNIKKTILVGHSLGGVLTSFIATKWPDLVEKLVLIDISPCKRVVKGEEATIVMQTFSAFLKKLINDLNKEQDVNIELSKQKLEEILKKKIKDESCIKEITDQLDQKNGNLCWKFDLETIDKFLNNYDQNDKFESKYNGDVLLIYGGKSRIFKIEEKDQILELNIMPNIIFKEIKDGGHNIHSTNSNEFIKEILPFLND